MNDLQIVRLDNTDISSWDFPVLRKELQCALDEYARIVYTDANIKDAKKDRANLNKAKKIIEDASKAYKAKCLAPYEAIKPQVQELVDMVEKQRGVIDDSVKDFETRQREAKEQEVRQYYDRKAVVLGNNLADNLYEKLFEKKWVNASTSKSQYEESVLEAINNAASVIDAIKATGSPFVDTLLEVYTETLSMDQVTAKQTELEEAAKKASLTTVEEAAAVIGTVIPVQVPATEQINVNIEEGTAIKVFATQSQFNQIVDFMKAIGVRYELL